MNQRLFRWEKANNERAFAKEHNAPELGTHYATNCFKFVDMPRSGSGATVLPAKTHTRLSSSTSYFVRSISTFLRAATFEHSLATFENVKASGNFSLFKKNTALIARDGR